MDPLYFANKILNVSHIRVYIRGNIIYGCLYENIPDKFRNYVQQNVDLHDYNFRNANDVYIYTPFAKSNGRFFSDTEINMMPSSNLYDFWLVHKMHVAVHFMCKIY